jgi:hypothetical protein
MAAAAALTTTNGVQGRFCTAPLVVCNHVSIPATALLFLSLPSLALPAPSLAQLAHQSLLDLNICRSCLDAARTAGAPAVTAEVESDFAADDGSGLQAALQ